MDFSKERAFLDAFAKKRGWEPFRTPKNLCMALSVEAGELVEIFQWMTEKQALAVREDEKTMAHVKEEVADILSYLIQFASVLDIDLEEAFWSKTKKNAAKYPESGEGLLTK